MIIGAVVGVVGIFATLWVAISLTKSAERQLIIQLQNEEAKKAIVALHSLTESKADRLIYASDIWKFLDSMDSAYLPDDLRDWAVEKLNEFWDKQVEAFPDEFADLDPKRNAEEWEAYLSDLPTEERRKVEFDAYREDFRRDATLHQRQALTGLATRKKRLRKLRNLFHWVRTKLRRRKSNKK